MFKLVFYDIDDDKTRTKLAKKLEELGLVRLQYSVFIGSGNTVYWEQVLEKIGAIAEKFDAETDSCCILAAEEQHVKAMQVFGKAAVKNNSVIDDPGFLIL